MTRGPDVNVREINIQHVAVPVAMRQLCTLARIDYEDAFRIENVAPEQWTAIRWAEAILSEAPMAIRAKLLVGWTAIGLKTSMRASQGSILGWEIKAITDDFVLFGRSSFIGMPGQLLFKREQDALWFATFVQQDNRIARAVWAATEPQHLPMVRFLLEQASIRSRLPTTADARRD
jgi:hypothetical protein